MRVGVVARVTGAFAASACAAATPVPLPAQARTTPAMSIQGVARVNILCLVADRSAVRLRVQERLCAQVRRIAAERAPVPVATIGFGDPALLAADSLGVLVHVAMDRDAATAVMSVRPYRANARQAALFGATPVAVPLGADDTIPGAAIAAALDQILPWRMPAAR